MQKLTQASSSTCEAGTLWPALSPNQPPPTHHACTPTASPSGVLRHRDDPFAVHPRSLRPCPHRCCQSYVTLALPECAHVRVPRDKCAVVGTWCELHTSVRPALDFEAIRQINESCRSFFGARRLFRRRHRRRGRGDLGCRPRSCATQALERQRFRRTSRDLFARPKRRCSLAAPAIAASPRTCFDTVYRS